MKGRLKLVNADAKITNKAIYGIIDTHARWIINRDSRSVGLTGLQYLYQTLRCVKVEEAPAIDDCCGIKSKCKVFRTVDKIPKLYQDNEGVMIKSVYTIDGSQEYSPITIQEYMRKIENPHTIKYDKSKYFYFNNDYLYFPNSSIRMIQIKGFFDEEVISCCEKDDDKKCISKLDQAFRFPERSLGELKQYVFNDLLGYKQPGDEQIDKNENRKN